MLALAKGFHYTAAHKQPQRIPMRFSRPVASAPRPVVRRVQLIPISSAQTTPKGSKKVAGVIERIAAVAVFINWAAISAGAQSTPMKVAVGEFGQESSQQFTTANGLPSD